MKFWIRNVLFLLVVLSIVISAGCQEKKTGATGTKGNGAYETLKLRYEGSVGSVTYPELAEDLGYLDPIKLEWIGNQTSGPASIQNAATGQTDFGGAFNGAIAKLIASGAPIKSVIGYYGSDKDTYTGYYVLNDSSIKDAHDLIGKKVGMNTMGAHAEFVLKEYLKQNGLTDEEIKKVTLVVLPPVSTEQALRQKQIDVAVLTGMLGDLAVKNGGIKKLFSDYVLLGPFTAGSYVFTEKFIKQNPHTVKKFVEATAKAIEWAQTHSREEVIARYEFIIKKRGRKEDTNTVQYWKSTGIAEKGGVIQGKEFKIWVDWLKKNGEFKDDQVKLSNLYTNEFNPYKGEIEKK
ncbi:ABC-type nitrate/sulfonate/bicarbonate transport system substrate-binding protein [Neobacillus bataviensis]|uniref:ABC-type nitrate/sulfonate/bicarbonate transport system substrate-binding protein n=1 Tax=Neobacillus bataviensis TaxID=220685 RepID=A0A561CQE5_9BACI|nr:ABC transporter substrate-binding protein [Neobacillus bataviensis]TWD93455.1 ABC-type nitrate/sulfonate/bicarbonate transport system substrate-binding protein [Neobacillus bataviensis]